MASANRYLQKKVMKDEALPSRSGSRSPSSLPTSRARPAGPPRPWAPGAAGGWGVSLSGGSWRDPGSPGTCGSGLQLFLTYEKMELLSVWIYSSRCWLDLGGW